jgi:hypothetical protein
MGGKTWKQAITLMGGRTSSRATPTATGSTRELDLDSMLCAQGGTKILSLGGTQKCVAERGRELEPLAKTRSDDTQTSSTKSAGAVNGKSARRQSTRFWLPGGIIPGPSPGTGPRVHAGMALAEYAAVEFETRLAGESDEEGPDETVEAARQRRESASDTWVDILVGSVEVRRMGGQDATQDDDPRSLLSVMETSTSRAVSTS